MKVSLPERERGQGRAGGGVSPPLPYLSLEQRRREGRGDVWERRRVLVKFLWNVRQVRDEQGRFLNWGGSGGGVGGAV